MRSPLGPLLRTAFVLLAAIATLTAEEKPTPELIGKFYWLPPAFFDPLEKTTIEITMDGRPVQVIDLRKFFESQGLLFPPGAKAYAFANTGAIYCENTRENLDLVDTLFVGGCHLPPVSIRTELTLVSLPAPPFSPEGNPPTYEQLKAAAGTEWKVLNTVTALSKSGTRTEVKTDEVECFFEQIIGPDGVAYDSTITYRFRNSLRNGKPKSFDYQGDSSTTFPSPQVLQLTRLPGSSTAIALIMRADQILPGGKPFIPSTPAGP